MKGSKEFLDICKNVVRDYANQHLDKTDEKIITEEDVYVVWYCKALKNHKALLSTTLFDGMYYECTFNGEKEEIYLDVYKKWENQCISLRKEK